MISQMGARWRQVPTARSSIQAAAWPTSSPANQVWGTGQPCCLHTLSALCHRTGSLPWHHRRFHSSNYPNTDSHIPIKPSSLPIPGALWVSAGAD